MEKTPEKEVPAEPAAAKEKPPSFLVNWFLQYYRLATAAVCLLLLILSYAFLFSPRLAAARRLVNETLAQAKEEQADLEANLKYLVAVETKRAQFTDDDIALVKSVLPSEPAVPEFLASLESLARESGATLEGVTLSILEPAGKKSAPGAAAKPGPERLPAGVRVLEASLNLAAATYAQVKTLLSNIEKSLRLMDAVSLLYTPAAKTYTITVQTYYLP